MVWVSHPTGNTFVRALLARMESSGVPFEFHTTLGITRQNLLTRVGPGSIRGEMSRRSYDLPANRLKSRSFREIGRLLSTRLGVRSLTRHESGIFSVDAIYQDLDRSVARKIGGAENVSTVYAYEDGALATFQAARKRGIQTVYELPIAYWETLQKLLHEEAERLPEWEPTLIGTRDSRAKLERKTEEATLAEVVVTPSKFVHDSIPPAIRQRKKCIVAPFGSPLIPEMTPRTSRKGPLRVLFAGSMSQRKGLADLFAAARLLKRSDVEIIVMGSLLSPIEFYKRYFPQFIYEPTRPHAEVLKLMVSCDIMALPSIVEGRALVQQEAMSCGLPLLVTPNAGGEDLIEEGKTGFLVPIRSPEIIAEKLNWFADHREMIPQMGEYARQKAATYTWERYADLILKGLKEDGR
ncbi:MAG: glycosyltransferase [Verrucomicrobiota bacterium]|nr:glycosyltransferase [Verrucomicrobiota bacterium]